MTALNSILLVFIGGGLGSLSRFGISSATSKIYKGNFPVGTLVSNTLACLVLGLVIYLMRDKLSNAEWIKYSVVIGFCGGFSTFSAFGLETVKLMQEGMYMYAIANIFISLTLGFVILVALAK